VQEGFLRYVQVRQVGEVITAPRAWLYRVIRNYLLDEIRNNGRSTTEPLKTPVAGSETEPDSMHALAALEEELRKTLSPRELECSLLRGSGFRYEEIAAAMNLRPGTVGAMLSRATRKVNKLRVEHPPAPAAHHSE
jgi:RNA polymerase sigma factor (sigma-70 family)